MSIRFEINAQGVSDLLRRLDVAPESVRLELQEAVNDTALAIYLSASGTVASRRVLNSLQVFPSLDEPKATVRAGFPARFVERGRPAGKAPPIDPRTRAGRRFRAWARRRGIDPFLAARAVGRKGVPARPFMAPAVEAEKAPFEDRISRAVDRGLEGR